MLSRKVLIRLLPLEATILLVAGAASFAVLLSLLAICDNLFVHPDYFRYVLPEALRGGLPIQWSDVLNSLQLRSPGEFRPRFLAYLIQALDQKIRLYLYDYFLVPPTLSPISWALELFIGPFFLFRAIRNLTGDQRAAVGATIVYTSTVGFLSGFTMLLLSGKNLSNVALILCVYAASEVVKQPSKNRPFLYQSSSPHKYLLLVFMLLGLFLDEMPIFVFLLIPILFPALFVPNSLIANRWSKVLLNALFFAAPLLIFLVIVVVIVPLITERYFAFRFDYFGNTLLISENTRGAKSLIDGPYARFSLGLVLENAMTLFGFAAVPSQISPFIKSDFGNYPGTQAANVAKWIFVLGALLVGAALALCGRNPAKHYLRATPVLFLGLFGFLTLLQVRHIPIATGFYYGSIFAVFLAVYVGLCYGALEVSRASLRTAAAGCVLLLVIIGTSNFVKVNRGWIVTHNEGLIRGSFQSMVQLAEPRALGWQELLDIWRSWKGGKLTRYLDETPISTGAVYLVAELQALDQARLGVIPPRHRLVNYTGY